MAHDLLTSQLRTLADAVVADWRWDDDDRDVSHLCLILYGLAKEICLAWRRDSLEIDLAVQHCMVESVGAEDVRSSELVVKASCVTEAMNDDRAKLINVGRAIHGMDDIRGMADRVFASLADIRRKIGVPERTVLVCLTPLTMLLAAREVQKQAPLTKSEVLEIRDKATCWRMTMSQAEAYYASQDAVMPLLRLNPRRVWEQWQKTSTVASGPRPGGLDVAGPSEGLDPPPGDLG